MNQRRKTCGMIMEVCEARRLLAFGGTIPAIFGGREIESIQETLSLRDGRTVVAGIYGAGANFQAGQASPTVRGDTDAFVALLDTNGRLRWVQTMGGVEKEITTNDNRIDFAARPIRAGRVFQLGVSTRPDEAGENITGLAEGIDGTIYVAGIFRGKSTFGNRTLDASRTRAGDGEFYDSFVARFSTGGAYRSLRQIGGPFNDVVTSIKIDSAGSVYLAGSFERNANFATTGSPSIKTPLGRADIFAVKYNADVSSISWFAQMGGDAFKSEEIEQASDLAVDATGNVYLAGTFSTRADFDPGRGTFFLTAEARKTGAFTARLSPTGRLVWAKQQVGETFVGNSAITLGNDGSVYSVGYFEDNAALDANQPTRLFRATPESRNSDAQETDLFITKWSRNTGATQWVKQIKGPLYELVGGAAFTSNNRLVIWGSAAGNIDFNPNAATRILRTPRGDFDDNNVGGRSFAYSGFVATYRTDGSLDRARLINARGADKDLFLDAGALRADGRSFVFAGRFQGGISIERVGSVGPAFTRDVPKNNYLDDGFVAILDETLNLPVTT